MIRDIRAYRVAIYPRGGVTREIEEEAACSVAALCRVPQRIYPDAGPVGGLTAHVRPVSPGPDDATDRAAPMHGGGRGDIGGGAISADDMGRWAAHRRAVRDYLDLPCLRCGNRGTHGESGRSWCSACGAEVVP